MSRFTQFTAQQAARLWTAWSTHRQEIARTRATAPSTTTVDSTARIFPVFPEAKTAGDTIKDFFVSQGSWILPFIIAGLLAISSGYLFANFQDFSWSAATSVKIA